MKMKPESTLFKVLVGSRLYGTHHELSDYDYKAVCLPSLEDILLNKKLVNRKVRPEGLAQGDKMLLGEDETEFLPIQVFFDDFFAGQTYAIELAFAVAQGKGIFADLENNALKHFCEQMMRELVSKFSTKSLKKMVGYAIGQSKVYGLKTERFTSIKEAVSLIKQQLDLNPNGTLGDDIEFLDKLRQVKFINDGIIHNPIPTPVIEIVNKQYMLNNKLETVYKSVNNTLQTYGSRVAEYEGDTVDWKALSHAIRITEQVLNFCENRELVFPSKNAKYIQSIKNGEVSLVESTDYLASKFALIDDAVEKSTLPEKTVELEEQFREWKLQILSVLYNNEFENIIKLNRLTF